MIQTIMERFGFIRKAKLISDLQFARSVGKRLDEHREVVEAIEESTDLFRVAPWHAGHMATQDDYLMRLYKIVYGRWPEDSIDPLQVGGLVRARPSVLGECSLPEYKKAKCIAPVAKT